MQDLPLEILGQICTHLHRHDLAKLVRTCKAANIPSERRLWQHLVIQNKSNARPRYHLCKSRATCNASVISRSHHKLVSHLLNRLDLAQAVHHLTIPATRIYSDHLVDMINIVGPSLGRIDFLLDSGDSCRRERKKIRWAKRLRWKCGRSC
jgi:hypothetical protein